jgi:hypothetical protein
MPTCVLGVGMEIYCPLTWPGPAAVLPDTPQQPLCGLWSNVRSSPIGHNGVSQFKDAISAAGTSGTEGTLMRSEQRQEQQVLNALAMCVCGGGGGVPGGEMPTGPAITRHAVAADGFGRTQLQPAALCVSTRAACVLTACKVAC